MQVPEAPSAYGRGNTGNAAAFLLWGGDATDDDVAIVTSVDNISRRALRRRTAGFAAALRKYGIGRGERVILVMRDTPDLIALVLAIMAAGAAAVPLSVRAESATIAALLAIARPSMLIIDDSVDEAALKAVAGSGRVLNLGADLSFGDIPSEAAWSPLPMNDREPAFWLVTSGTAGKPKAVVHDHGSVRFGPAYLRDVLRVGRHDRIFVTSRLHFAYAFGITCAALRLGVPIVLHEDWPTAQSVVDTIAMTRPSIVFSVPVLYRMMLKADLAGSPALGCVRTWVSAGERLHPALAADWAEARGATILDSMGCTESVHMLMANSPSASRSGASGRPAPGVDVRLIGDDGAVVRAPETPGALEVRAAFLCRAYRQTAADEQEVRPPDRFVEEWLRTGDAYRCDADGFYHHVGRSDDMLRIAGLWIAPVEIEDRISLLPEVDEAAVVQATSREGLNELCLFIVPGRDTDSARDIAAAAQRALETLPTFKRPRRLHLVRELPRTATGKVQRFRLRELAATLAFQNDAQPADQ